jgi:hypothetical protein
MKKSFRRLAVIAMLLSLFCPPAVAQSNNTSALYNQVTALHSKHKDKKGVLAWACDSGLALQSVKMMIRKEFGTEFTNAINSFAILLYKDAAAEDMEKIVGDIALITKSLREIDITEKMKSGEKARGFVRLSGGDEKITDFLIVVEAPAPKLIYIGGKIPTDGSQIKR